MSPNNFSGEREQENRIIAIASGKGGTGKTVSTLNLGMALHNLGKDVLVLDADLQDPNLGINLGIYSPQTTVNEAVGREKNLLEALYIHDTGLRVIPASLSINYLDSDISPIGRMTESMEGYVLIDCGPGISQNLISTINASDSVIAVTNPIRSSISGTIRLAEIARDLQKPIEGVIVNNLTSKEVSNEEIEQITGCPVLGEVPYDSKVDKAIVNRKPLVEHSPYSPASIAFKKIAHNLAGMEYNASATHHIKKLHHYLKSLFST